MDEQNQAGKGKVNPIQVQKYLKGVDYPATKQDLINKAKEEGADDRVIATLEAIKDENFDTPASVSQAIGKIE